jgi:hypothetical protein
MTAIIGAPAAGGAVGAGDVDVGGGAACEVLGDPEGAVADEGLEGEVNDGADSWAFPPTDCEHPATSTDAAIRQAIRIIAKASGPTPDRRPGAAARHVR